MTGSRRFDGSTDAIRFELSTPNPTAAITLLAVIKPINVSDDVALLTGADYIPEWGWSRDQVYLFTPTTPASGPFAPTANRWQVFATTKAAGSQRPIHHLVQLDNANPPLHEEADEELSDFTPNLGWDLGTDDANWGNPARWWYEGRVAGFAIFDRALSNTEIEACTSWATIRALGPVQATRLDGEPPFAGQEPSRTPRSTHTAESPPSFWPSSYYDAVMADEPSAYLRLGETSGTAAYDALGGEAGEYVGTVALGQPSLVLSVIDGAASFDAVGRGYVAATARPAFDLGDTFTLEAWVRLDELDFRSIVDKGEGAYILRTTEDGRVLLRRNSYDDIAVSTTPLTSGTVHHVVATKLEDTAHIYIDGADVTEVIGDSVMENTSWELNIGAADAGTTNWVGGAIDEVALYGTALSAARVRAHYDAGVGAIVARWTGSGWEEPPIDVWDGAAWRRTEAIGSA